MAAPACVACFPLDFNFFAWSGKMKFVNEIRKSTILEQAEYVPFSNFCLIGELF